MSLRLLSRDDSLKTYFKDLDKKVLVSASDYLDLTEQEIYSRLQYTQPYYGQSVTDMFVKPFYKHQSIASKFLFTNDSIMIVHEPGTGKTITQIKTMMDLLIAKAINRIVIVNNSPIGNIAAIATMKRLYNQMYHLYFDGMSFNNFKRNYIYDITMSKISSHNYQNYTGIVIDEAHNLLSDNETKNQNKDVYCKNFVEVISRLKGIKLILSTATPMFGSINSLGKFKSIMFRDLNETDNKIPPSMVSFTKINYNHIKAEYPQNSAYIRPDGKSMGDFSFKLSNGKDYDFHLFIVKPSPMQIADFFNLNFIKDPSMKAVVEKDNFQTYDKPLIIESNPHVNEKGKLTTESAIGDATVQLIKSSEDGTVFIYTDTKEKGVYVIAEYLKRHGIEEFSLKENSKNTYSTSVQEISNKITLLNEKISVLIGQEKEFEENFKTDISEEGYNKLHVFLEQIPENYKSNYLKFIEHYEKSLKINKMIEENLKRITSEKDEIQKEILKLKAKSSQIEKKQSLKYMIYTSGMTNEDNEAYRLFNSPENWDGSIIKVLIGSKIIRDGRDLKHVLFTIMYTSEWRMAGMLQATRRGFRSNSHLELIKQRAIKLCRKNPELTYEEAEKSITEEKISFQIYQCLMSFEILEEEDIEKARRYMSEEHEQFDNKQIIEMLNSDENEHKAGRKIYEAAIEHYVDVGAAQMNLASSAIDFKINVPPKFRIEFAKDKKEELEFMKNPTKEEILGKRDAEIFYTNDYVYLILNRIKEILFERNIINTDELIDLLLAENDFFTLEIISWSIVELTKKKKFIYNPKTHINMRVDLYETETESILYLKSIDINNSGSHPYTEYVNDTSINFEVVGERIKTKIEDQDLEMPKRTNALIKLKDLLEKSFNPEVKLNLKEIKFLYQMNNYWAFSWTDLDSGKSYKQMNVYVFRSRVPDPDINILAKDLVIYSYDLSSKAWRGMKTSNFSKMNTFFTRFSSLIDLYRNFNFSVIPEFNYLPEFQTKTFINPFDMNGVIMIKGFYNPTSTKQKTITRELFNNDNVLPEPYKRNVLIKIFGNPHSKGNQRLKEDKNNLSKSQVVDILEEISEKKISIYFFLYNIHSVSAGEEVNIFDIKRREMEEMKLAINGKPTTRFKISVIEKIILDEERKREIYRMIYKPKTGLI